MALNDNTADYTRLEELGGSDYEIADGQPNIKGWDVKDERGMQFGEVDELLFNPHSQKVRYIVLDTDVNEFKMKSRKILIPIGIAELHENDDDVILPNVTASQLEALPDYTRGSLAPETEYHIRNTFSSMGAAGLGTGAMTAAPEGHFYEHEQFNTNRLYNRRKLLPESKSPRQITERSTKDQYNRNTDLP